MDKIPEKVLYTGLIILSRRAAGLQQSDVDAMGSVFGVKTRKCSDPIKLDSFKAFLGGIARAVV